MATTITTNEMLSNVAKTVGEKYGFERATAEFVAFADFKVRWTRSYKYVDFTVSDYLKGADEGVLEDLFDIVIRKFKGLDGEYSERFKGHITAPAFSETHRPTYLGRKRAEKENSTTFHGIPVFFSKRTDSPVAEVASTLMRSIIINSRLKDAPQEVQDAVIAHGYNVIQNGLPSFGLEGQEVECNTAVANDWLVRNGMQGIY